MNLRLSSLTLAALAAVTASPAFAQSASGPPFNSMLFGVLDVSARLVRNGSAPTFKGEGTDGLTSSRLGVRGTEDLGDGLKAGYWLEASLAPDTGTTNATRFFNRRSTVSLIDPRFGELRLGRDTTPAFNAFNSYDPFGTNGLGALLGNGSSTGIVSGLGSGANTLSRADNQISYFLPQELGGFYGQLAVAAAEGTTGSRYVSGRVGYAAGPLDVSAVYAQTTVASNDRFKQALVGAGYDFGMVKLSGLVMEGRYDVDGGENRRQRVYQLGASAPFGRHVLRIDAIRGDMSGGAAGSGFADGDDATQLALGYQYNLSKRTAIYGVAATLRNKGASKLAVAAGYPGLLSGENSTGYDLGLRHSF